MAQQQTILTNPPCSAAAIGYPALFGAEFLGLEVSLVTNYSRHVPEGYNLNGYDANVVNVDFCNVTVTYTHPGQNDTINVQAWMPTETWNEKMQGVGGGGWAAGMFELSYMTMAGGLADGYMSITTDGGHTSDDPQDWALRSPGNIDLYALQNLASMSLVDAALIGKDLAKKFYGKPPKYSYWNGCSQGGRQGLMLAQRYPTAYDGIVASAPAVHWGELGVATYWPQFVMNQIGEYPHPCELDEITRLAISYCDGDDGIVDGIISGPDTCSFDATTAVGRVFDCRATGRTMQISQAAAIVANAAWKGPRTADDSFLWYGVPRGATLTGFIGLANTECKDGTKCVGKPFAIATDWIRLFVKKDPAFDISNITLAEYEQLFRASVQEFDSIIGTSDPNLDEFRDAGGKMLAFQGLADSLLVPGSMRHYYNAVRARDPDVQNYYRLFESGGLGHCFGGAGGYPGGIFKALADWVENGNAPDTLDSMTPPNSDGVRGHKLLCPYPQTAHYKGKGNIRKSSNFFCN